MGIFVEWKLNVVVQVRGLNSKKKITALCWIVVGFFKYKIVRS